MLNRPQDCERPQLFQIVHVFVDGLVPRTNGVAARVLAVHALFDVVLQGTDEALDVVDLTDYIPGLKL